MKKRAKSRARNILIIVAVGGALAAAAACGHHKAHKTHKASGALVTAQAHVSGPDGGRWYLTVKGKKKAVTVTERVAKRCQPGERYPACAKR